MKLERASLLAVLISFVCLILLLMFGAWSNQQLQREHRELDTLLSLHDQLDDIAVATERLLRSPPRQARYQAVQRDAQALQQALAAQPDPSGSIASIAQDLTQFRDALLALESAGSTGVTELPGTSSDAPDARDQLSLVTDVSERGIAIDRAFGRLLNERQEAAYADIGVLVATFMFATAAFGFVCITTYAYIHRRIATSISALASTVEQIGSGKTYLRVPTRRSDEVGALASAINRLLDSQADALHKIEQQRQQLRRQSELLIVAGTIARVGGWSLMLGDDHVVWSDVVAEIHGKPPGFSPTLDEAIAFYAEEDRTRIRDAFSACIDNAVPYDLQLQLIDSEGQPHWVRTAGVPVRNELGRIIGVHGALQDISASMEIEQQLRRSQRLESIGQLTGGIAHDFNNILTVILGNAELLAETLESDERLASLAGMIRDSAERGARLTQQLLTFARRQTLHPESLRLDRLLDGIEDMLDRSVGEDITLRRRGDTDLWYCRLDTTQLENAVLNLAINARDAMPDGGTIDIDTANFRCEPGTRPPVQAMPPGDYVRLTIRDTGSGITPPDLDRLFEPFFTTKPKGRGTGLGLPMVYGFVKQSAGFIDVSSRVDQGTLVSMYFPRSEDSPQAAPPTTRPGPLQRANHRQCILLVEDDDLVRRFAEQQLRALGYQVLSAASGVEAMAILRQRSDIDLLFTDVVMPGGMSGRDLAEAATRERPDLKVLYTSGYSENVISHDGRLDDGIDLLRKPYRLEALSRKLADILGERTA